jgi:uncharacterized RDD family membrane protein YckC
MTWNYLAGSEQRGPISEADFDALVHAGTITDDTYVWREGMAEWKPYGTVKAPAAGGVGAPPPLPAAGQVICGECGRSFPLDQVIRHGNVYVCASCKPVFLQKVKEGVAPTMAMNYAGFGIRFGAKFLDGIIVGIPIYSLVFAIQGFGHPQQPDPVKTVITQIIGIAIGLTYSTFFVGKYGATPGKMAAKLLVVNADGSKVSYAKALGRYFAAEWVSGCFTLCIGYLMILWDDQKRGLHDRICGTRVIRK